MAEAHTQQNGGNGDGDDPDRPLDSEKRSFMTTMNDYDQPTLEEADSVYDFEGVVVRESINGDNKRAHAPGQTDPVLPLCEVHDTEGSAAKAYKYKPPGTIPRGYYDECERCNLIIRGEKYE